MLNPLANMNSIVISSHAHLYAMHISVGSMLLHLSNVDNNYLSLDKVKKAHDS